MNFPYPRLLRYFKENELHEIPDAFETVTFKHMKIIFQKRQDDVSGCYIRARTEEFLQELILLKDLEPVFTLDSNECWYFINENSAHFYSNFERLFARGRFIKKWKRKKPSGLRR